MESEYLETTNVTITNCNVSDWDTANIYFENANGNTLTDITTTSSPDYGIYLEAADYNNLTQITATSNTERGIYLHFSDNNIITNSIAENNKYGIYLWASHRNQLTNITADSNTPQYGIYISSSDYNNLTNFTANNNGRGITLTSSDNNILRNFTANNNSVSEGLTLFTSDNNLIIDFTANNNDGDGIHLQYTSQDNNITNFTLNTNDGGLFLDGSSGSSYMRLNIIKNGHIENNTDYGIHLDQYAGNNQPNTLYNLYLNNTNNIQIETTYLNYWNTTQTVKTNIINGPNTAGNYWAKPNITGFSQTCLDSDENGICDTNFTLATNNIDYLPLTVNTPPTTTTPSIAPAVADFDDDLNCSFTITDPDPGQTLSANYTWFLNRTKNLFGQISVTNGVTAWIQLLSGNTTSTQNWTCSITPYDGFLYGNNSNSSELYIYGPPCENGVCIDTSATRFFSNGTFVNTTIQNLENITLSNANITGTFTSKIFDAGDISYWNISWSEKTTGWVNFSNEQTIDGSQEGARPLKVADFDGDGDLDIIVGSTTGSANKLVWYENNGTGGGWTKTGLASTGNNRTQSIVVEDFDGDSDVDIITFDSSGGAGIMKFWRNNGTGGFTSEVIANRYNIIVEGADAKDIDGDGDIDVLAYAWEGGPSNISWYENNGAGGFTEHIVDDTTTSISGLKIVDIDGDGDMDFYKTSTKHTLQPLPKQHKQHTNRNNLPKLLEHNTNSKNKYNKRTKHCWKLPTNTKHNKRSNTKLHRHTSKQHNTKLPRKHHRRKRRSRLWNQNT